VVRFVLGASVLGTSWPRAVDGGIARLVVADLAFAPRAPARLRLKQRLPGRPPGDRAPAARPYGRPRPAAVSYRLELARVEPAAGQQLPLFTPQAARDARLAWQLARLAIAFGVDRVRRVEITDAEAPLAEWRWRWAPVAGVPVTGAGGERDGR
jgi:hypothetical protein